MKIILLLLFSLILAPAGRSQVTLELPAPARNQQVDPGPAHSDPYAIKYTGPKVADKSFWKYTVLSTATSAIPFAGLDYCSHGNVERCVAGYGARWQSMAFTEGIAEAVTIAIAFAEKKSGQAAPAVHGNNWKWIFRAKMLWDAGFGAQQASRYQKGK